MSDLEPELLWAVLLGLKVATEDGGYPAYHWRDDPSVTNEDRLRHAAEHLWRALFWRDLDELHHIEHALADLAIVLARRAGGLP